MSDNSSEQTDIAALMMGAVAPTLAGALVATDPAGRPLVKRPASPASAWAARRKGRLAFMHLFAATPMKPIVRKASWRLPWPYRVLAWATGLVLVGIAAGAVVTRAFNLGLRWSIG